MNLGFSDEQQAIRRAFADLMMSESTLERVRAAESSGFDDALWRVVTATGLLGVGISEEHGGSGAGLLELALIGYEAGRRLAPIPFAEPVAAARLLERCAVKDVLAEVLDGDRLVSLALQPGSVDCQLLVDGAVADVVLSIEGDALVAVERPSSVKLLSNLGSMPLARWGDSSRSVLTRGPAVPVAYAAALDDVRALRAAALAGLTVEAIDIGVRYALERTAFGVSIGSYQAVAHPMADAITAHDGAQLLTWKACWALDGGREDGGRLAAMAFAFAAETALHASQHSLHVHGGFGFTAESSIQLYYRRAKAWATPFGDPRKELLSIADRLFGATAGDALHETVAAG